MKDKINIAELLKDYPQGMELYSPIYGVGNLTKVTDRIHVKFPKEHNVKCFRLDGKVSVDGECMLFPKGKTTWEGFQRPFKDGDILATDLGSVFYLNTRLNTNECYGCYVGKGGDGSFHICEPFAYKECCGLATEEEKQKLFKAIKDNGYKWNAETKTLEKLIKPIFKVGNKIKYKNGRYKNGVKEGIILSITDDTYDVAVTNDMGISIPIADEYNWELVPNKFDITTLIPFESRVLVREDKTDVWQPAFYGFFNQHNKRFYTTSTTWLMCIPYNEDTKHLIGTTDDCDEFYKTW